MHQFPEPVSGKPIPKGWFGRLVRYMNSLRVRGDGRYFSASQTPDGTTIAPTPALLQALNRSGGTPGAEGGGTPATLGFPNFNSSYPNQMFFYANPGSPYINTFAYDVWLFGNVSYSWNDSNGYASISIGEVVSITPIAFSGLGIGTTNMDGLSIPFTIPVPNNNQIQIYTTGNASVSGYAYKCI